MTLNVPRSSGGNRVWVVNPIGEPIPVSLVNDSTGQSFIFDETGALVMIDFVHHNLHEGILFRTNHRNTLAINGVMNLVLEVPNQDIEYHFEGHIATSAGATVQFFRNTIANNDGTEKSVYNANQRSTNTNTMKVRHNPTVTNAGEEIDGSFIGAGANNGGEVRGDIEWELNYNRKYLLRITSNGNNNRISARLNWYEIKEE